MRAFLRPGYLWRRDSFGPFEGLSSDGGARKVFEGNRMVFGHASYWRPFVVSKGYHYQFQLLMLEEIL